MSGKRRLEELYPGPGPGAGADRSPHRTTLVLARIALVATIVVGQLWALTVALDAYLADRMDTVWWLLGFQALSFALVLAVWRLAPSDR